MAGAAIGTVAPRAASRVFLTADGAARPRAAEASWSTRADRDRRDRMDAAQSRKAADGRVDSTGLDLDAVVGVIVDSLQKSR